MPPLRNRRVQIGQGFGIVQGPDLRHNARQQIEDTIRFGDKPAKIIAPIARRTVGGGLKKGALQPVNSVRRRQIEQGQVVAVLEMRPVFTTEGRAPFRVHQPRGPIGEFRNRIVERRNALRPEEGRPSRAEAFQDVVETRARPHQFSVRRAFQIRSPELKRPLEPAVLVEHNAGRDQRGPRQMIGQLLPCAPVFPDIQHAKCPFWRR